MSSLVENSELVVKDVKILQIMRQMDTKSIALESTIVMILEYLMNKLQYWDLWYMYYSASNLILDILEYVSSTKPQ